MSAMGQKDMHRSKQQLRPGPALIRAQHTDLGIDLDQPFRQ
jgi:hypothetical protein